MILSIIHSLILAQTMNLNVTPIETRQDGVKVPSRQRQYVIDCRTNMTCAVDGGTLFLSASGGSGGGKVAEAYAADASITAQAFDHDPASCSVGQYVTDLSASGVLTCSTPSGGGGGSANYSTGSLVFDGGYDMTASVTAAWATGSSSIICGPMGEEASVEGLVVTPLVLSSGSFTVRGEPRNGKHSGSLSFVCTGL